MSFLNEFEEKKEAFEEEEFVIDDSYAKKRRKRNIIVILILLITSLLSYLIYYNLTHIKIVDLVGKTVTEASDWALENKVTLNKKTEYSTSVKKGEVISQVTEEGESIKKGSIITLTVSDGPDPDVKVVIPDFKNYDVSDIEKWIEENYLLNYNVSYIYHNSLEYGKFINYVLSDGKEESFKRKNRINFYVSKGQEKVSDEVKVIDLTSKTKTEIIKWGNENNIKINFIETFSSDYPIDQVIKQSVESGEKVVKGSSINITISKGEGVKIPDFNNYTKEDAQSFATNNNLNINIKEEYKEGYTKGSFISQSVKVNSTLKSGDEIIVTYALGKISIESYEDSSLASFENYISELNNKGAHINVNYKYEYNDSVLKNHIIYQDIKNINVEQGQVITIVISKGNEVMVNNYLSKTKEEIKTNEICDSLTCIFEEVEYSGSDYNKGQIFKQSIDSGNIVSGKSIITFSVVK